MEKDIKKLQEENRLMRTALEQIAKEDELVKANDAFCIHAFNRCRNTAQYVLNQLETS